MGVELTILHWIYLIFICVIIATMIMKRDTSLVCILGIFLLGLFATASLYQAVMGVFTSFIYAIKELMSTILIISVITAMGKILLASGINEVMVRPFAKLIKGPVLAYWVIGILMMIISWFFWPSPAVALLGAVLLPVATKVKLPAMGVAIAMNLFGHGIALSSDFIIQGAPKLTADGAGIPVGDVVAASVPLVIIMGVVTTVTAFWFLKRDMDKGLFAESDSPMVAKGETDQGPEAQTLSPRWKGILALGILLLYLLDIVIMYMAKLQGSDATALIGGTSVFILVIVSMIYHKGAGLEKIMEYLIEGLQFGFRIFGPVIPIAAFFYLGDEALGVIFGQVLPQSSAGLVNDLGVALAYLVPLNAFVGAATLTTVGAVTGLDGSGFSGISLVGPIARIFATSIGSGISTLTALGQIAAIWVGGGTIIPWALIPAAAICGVDPFELARRNMKPVIIGLIVTTIGAIFLI